MQKLTFITSNEAKAEQFRRHLDFPVTHQSLDLPEIQSLDLKTVARDKAERAFAKLGTPVLVEDTALTFHALGKLPGPLIKWFLHELENKGLTQLITPEETRAATAEVCFVMRDDTGAHVFSSAVPGTIAPAPRGEYGFGWDPIFIPEGHILTWGEMDEIEQAATSMRRIALAKLQTYLNENWG